MFGNVSVKSRAFMKFVYGILIAAFIFI